MCAFRKVEESFRTKTCVIVIVRYTYTRQSVYSAVLVFHNVYLFSVNTTNQVCYGIHERSETNIVKDIDLTHWSLLRFNKKLTRNRF